MKDLSYYISECKSKYNITTILVKAGDINCKNNGIDSYINRSACYGCPPTIELGIYDDPELKLISFFHEVGHFLDPVTWSKVGWATMYDMESSAWVYAYGIALEYGITFSDNAKSWAKVQLESYYGFEEREIGFNFRGMV